MGKHFTAYELDLMHQLHAQGASAAEIKRQVAAQRRPRGGPGLTSARRALRGRTFKRAKVEIRGRPRSPTHVNLRALNTARKRLVESSVGA